MLVSYNILKFVGKQELFERVKYNWFEKETNTLI